MIDSRPETSPDSRITFHRLHSIETGSTKQITHSAPREIQCLLLVMFLKLNYSRKPSKTINMSILRLLSTLFGTIFIGFGINAILRPAHALTFFELAPPSSLADRALVDSLMIVYGARDVFMGLAIYAAAYFGTRKSLGLTLIAASAVAFVDGMVCYGHGKGEWNHWGYAPVITVVGGLLLG